MKKIKKIAVFAAAVMIMLSAASCAVETPQESQSSENESSTSSTVEVNEADYEDSLKGLVDFFKAKSYIDSDPISMEASFIGAEKGEKYTGSFEGTNNITIELYEYDTENLNETAKQMIESAKKNGTIELMGMTVSAVISDNGKYMMMYKDSASGETHDSHKEQVINDFKSYKK